MTLVHCPLPWHYLLGGASETCGSPRLADTDYEHEHHFIEHEHHFSHIRGGDQPEVSVFVGFLMSGIPPLLLQTADRDSRSGVRAIIA